MLELTDDWQQQNKAYLIQALEQLRGLLETKANLESAESFSKPPLDYPLPPALEQLCQGFGLSPFERDILLLCAGMELDGRWGFICAKASGNSEKPYPTFSLALSTLPDAHWNALIPTAPLREWQLITLRDDNSIIQSQLSIDERIVHYLMGISYLDERLSGLIEPVTISIPLVPSHYALSEQMVKLWSASTQEQLPIIQLWGIDKISKRAIAVSACQQLGLSLQALFGELLPLDIPQLNLIRRLCEREWILSQTVLLLETDYLEGNDPVKEGLIAHFIENLQCPLIVSSRERRFQRERPLMSLEVSYPTTPEQRVIWQRYLKDSPINLNGQINALVTHFNLNVPMIQVVSHQFKGIMGDKLDSHQLSAQLWKICREGSRPRLEELAQRIDAKVFWEDLVLPEEEKTILREIAIHVRQRSQVYENWGFQAKNSRGLGISALFAGASGTGKTLAAEVLGNELHLDVYRIDLSSVVSKYIGETEKNLKRIFDAAEGCGAILLFDEADALFGKRSEVKDSHDRYANMEVSYILQRIEAYRGLAILTTNLKDAIDQAFIRRIRFIVQFPFPDASQRAAIWQTVFPHQTPTEGLDFQKLARLTVAGGNIRNIALNAAFLAANEGEAVQMKHILQATKSEYSKLEKTLTDMEVKGWV